MNNILTFEDYKKMNIRQVESVIYRQFIEEDIKDEAEVNEGLIRNAINKASSKFIQTALGEEIEKGKELEKSIKEALDGLNKGFEEIEKKLETKGSDPESSLSRIEKVKEAIKAVQSQAFDTLTMIGSEGEIDFAGFMGSATVAAAVNFGVLFTPIRSLFIARKAYKYFLGIIKQTIRRNLLIIQLNFDQFENLILQKSFETDDDAEERLERDTMVNTINDLTAYLCKDKTLFKKESQHKKMKEQADIFIKLSRERLKLRNENSKKSPYGSLFSDQYNNTYTKTLEQIKQYINDDSQKELDALKNSITKMAGNDVELGPFGELLICAAEEYAINTNHGINNNFIKMSSVFNLENQKKLIELIVETQNENKEEIKKRRDEIDIKKEKEELDERKKQGKELYESKIKDSKKVYTYEEFEKEFDEDNQKCLNTFFLQTDEGKEAYKEFISKNPLYKYYIIEDLTDLDDLLNSIDNMKIVGVSNLKNLFNNIVNKDHALYYMMAERSIKNGLESNYEPSPYFGFEGLTDRSIDEDTNILKKHPSNKKIDKIFIPTIDTEIILTPKKENVVELPKEKYFLKFEGGDYGNKLFGILHKEFKTKIFSSEKNSTNLYVDNNKISKNLKNKVDLIRILNKHLKTNFNPDLIAKYLIRLEAHMLLKKEEPWFVPKNNEILKNCFEPNSRKILNQGAFVEINSDDYESIKEFLETVKKRNNFDNNFDTKKEEKTNKDNKDTE